MLATSKVRLTGEGRVMLRLDVTCTEFLDNVPVAGCPVTIELRIAPRFFVQIGPPPAGAGPTKPKPNRVLVPDFELSETLVASAVSDDLGTAAFDFDVDQQWSAVSATTKNQSLPEDAVGYITARAELRALGLGSQQPVLVARSPDARVATVLVIDPAKIMIGHTTETSSRVRFQLHGTPRPGFRFLAELTTGGQQVDRRTIAIGGDSSHTGVTTYVDLVPATDYSVALVSDELATRSRTELARGRLRTLARDPGSWTLGFASCHLPTDEESLALWKRTAARRPTDLMLLIGDQIYGDSVEAPSATSSWFDGYVQRYNQLWAYQPVRDVLRSTPTLTIFDDHEVTDDWGVASESEIGRDRVSGALTAYRRFQDVLNPPRPEPGVFDYSWTSGRLAGYVLDQRSHRGGGGTRNVLGADQFERFRRWAAGPEARAADVVIVASSVPLAYLPTERLEDLVGEAATVTGAAVGALVGGLIGGPPGAILGGFLGAAGSAIVYDEVTEDIRDPDLQDQWVHDRNQAELADLLDVLFDLGNDITGGVPGPTPRAVILLSGDVHVGGMHLLHSNRRGGAHDHSRNRLIYQFTSSPISTHTPGNRLLHDVLEPVGSDIDLSEAEFLKTDPDRQAGNPLNVSRFFLDSNGDKHYAAEYLGVIQQRNMGHLTIERVDGRRYRFTSIVDGSTDSLVAMFDLDLEAPRVQPHDLFGERLTTKGRITMIRAHDVETGFGPPQDRIDGEVVIELDSEPGRAFGFPLRNGPEESAHQAMLAELRDAFNQQTPISIDYDRTGPRNGRVVRVLAQPH